MYIKWQQGYSQTWKSGTSADLGNEYCDIYSESN